ncbi:MAG: Maf family protein [Phycisphaeraceae bacterium]
MPASPPLILASRSARRAALLRAAGFAFTQQTPPFDDPPQPEATDAAHTAEMIAADLAWRKAASLHSLVAAEAVVLAADTICVDADGQLIGQPRDSAHARQMIQQFANTTHEVVSGVALLGPGDAPPQRFADTTVVHVGFISDEQIDRYLQTRAWRGKAGGYNLFDRQQAGWPITVTGDPATVVGLPMRRLLPALRQRGVTPDGA